MSSDELPFCAPDDTIGVMVTHILELPRSLRVPENFRLLVSESRDGRFPDVPSSVLMHVLGADSHQLDDERVPTIRLDLRTAAVRVKMPLQAADICFQDWERPLLSRSRWSERSRVLKKARRFGIEAPVTVVAGTCLLPVDDWGTTCEQQEAAVESSLDASLDLMNSFVLSLGLMANDPSFGPFERGDLPFLCPVIVESFPMQHGRSGRSFLREIHDHPPDVGQFPDFPKPLFEAATALATSDHAHDEPFFLFYELFQRAQSTLLSQRTAQSVLATGTAIEVVLNTVVREASVALGETESRRMGILSAPLASIVRDHLARYTNMVVDLDDPDNVAGAWWENGYDLRNRVAHAGYRPSMEEAVRAFDSASELVLAMRDGLLNRAETETVGQSLGWGRREERQEWDEALGLPDRPE